MKTINIFGKFVSKLKGGYVASADQVYDETLGKYQSEINQSSDVEAAIDNLVETMPPSVKNYIGSEEWNAFNYDGARIIAPVPKTLKVNDWAVATGGQAMAICKDKLFRLTNGGSCSIYQMSEEGLTSLGSIGLDGHDANWHCNSAQFAPTIESGQTYPLLYIASTYSTKCFVVRFTQSGTFSSTLVQTIQIEVGSLMNVPSANIQIGDDGHIYAFFAGASCVRCYKYRKVLPSEGNVTLSDSDIIDYTSVDVGYVYDDRPWQGGKIYDGKLYLAWGKSSALGFYVVDLTTKKCLNDIVLTSMAPVGEFEDIEFADGVMYGCYWPSNKIIKIVFE